MAKKKSPPKCPACKKDIKNHKLDEALACVEKLELSNQDDIYMMGKKYANLKSWGQKHEDRNIMTLQFGKRFIETIMPELDILHEVLQSQVKENKDDEGSEETVSGSGEDNRDPQDPTS